MVKYEDWGAKNLEMAPRISGLAAILASKNFDLCSLMSIERVLHTLKHRKNYRRLEPDFIL
uniref:Uncharacterized protein n=1 Tax=Romanomermis culicivorax TaxID=13658 RepID=A0A915HTS8_ROMCU